MQLPGLRFVVNKPTTTTPTQQMQNPLQAGAGTETHGANVVTLKQLQCNLCHMAFQAANSFNRFCRSCKQQSELYRFHDSIPAGI